MQPVIGIVCEYDPFHRGHRRQFELARQRLPGAFILCLMSGCFTQRGMPALHAPAARAEAALRAGADAVLELPCAFAVRDAEGFALGGIRLLSELRCVTHLCFGAEDGLEALAPAAQLLEAPDDAFTRALKSGLDGGASLVSARGRALSERFPQSAEALQKPNNILALCYLRALLSSGSGMRPLPVKREGGYHEAALATDGFPSATAVRAACLRGHFAQVDAACGYALPRAPVCKPDALDRVLLYLLRAAPPERLAELPLCSEGLENRLSACARSAATREELLSALKTKRYAYARLSRLCCHALLGVTSALLASHPAPEYARLLGFRRESAALLAQLKAGRIPVVAKAADGAFSNPLYQLDCRAYDLWALGAGLPAGLMLRQRVVIV